MRLDSTRGLPSATALESRWSRFASYGALSDSIGDDGGKLERGPVRLDLRPQGVGGLPVAFRADRARRVRRSPGSASPPPATGSAPAARLREAWSNLLGASVPSIAGSAQATRLEEARRWLQRADSALRNGDWAAFGQAWRGLRDALGLPAETVER